jgi:hypothetical protein
MNNIEVLRFPPTEHMTPEMALQAVLTRCQLGEVTDVLIVGYDTDNDFISFSSKMTRADAVWLLEKAKQWAMDGGNK